jgi:cysteine-rich repeat protein
MTSIQRAGFLAAVFTITAVIVMPRSVWSDTVGELKTFNAGETAKAAEVNQNFSEIADTVNENDRLAGELDARVAAVEATDPVPGPQGAPGEPGLTGPQGEQGPAGTDLAAEIAALEMQLGDLQAQVTFFQTYLDSFCGNGMVEPGLETCDDGNTTDDENGCTVSCQATNVCGNGIIESGVETCDDGGTANGDGCSDSCSIEPGGFCNGEPSVCGGRVETVCADYCAQAIVNCLEIGQAEDLCIDACIADVEDAEQSDGPACRDAELTALICITELDDCQDIFEFAGLNNASSPFPVCTAEIDRAIFLCPLSILLD